MYLRSFVRPLVLMLMLAVVSLGTATQAFAGLRSCRVDPIVWLSNGEQVQVTAVIDEDASAVRRIVYTVHGPVGTTADRVVYTGGALKDKEIVYYVADQAAGQYRVVTEVETTNPGVGALITAAMRSDRQSARGVSGTPIVIAFQR